MKEFLKLKLKKYTCRKSEVTQRENYYQKGSNKLKQQFDVIKLFKTMKKVDLLSKIILSKH